MHPDTYMTEDEKIYLAQLMAENLETLRNQAGITQEYLSSAIGMSRQTYIRVRSGKERLSWKNYMALMFFFEQNQKTRTSLYLLGLRPECLRKMINPTIKEDATEC